MSAPSAMRRRCTSRPCGPVWWVLSVMPSIFAASSRTSPMERASFTPPPLPRPPAWTCAFTTHTGPRSDSAAATASSTEKAGAPRGVATPYLRKISLPWYSWMFMVGWSVVVAFADGLDLLAAAIPLRIILRHRWLGRVEGVATIDVWRAGLGVLQALAGHRLGGPGGGGRGELGGVVAATHPAQKAPPARAVAAVGPGNAVTGW